MNNIGKKYINIIYYFLLRLIIIIMDLSNAGQAIPGDSPPPNFSPPMRRMSASARVAMSKVGFPVELRDKILNETSYAYHNKMIIHFLKENMGEEAFSRFIYLVTSPMHILTPYGTEIYLRMYPSWLTDVIEEYLNLLKSVQDLPNIFVPLRQILDEYVKTRGYYDPKYSDQEFIDLSSRIVSDFITVSRLDPSHEVATKIKIFFTTVVNILLKVINDNSSELYTPQLNLSARLRVKGNIQDIIIHFLRDLIELNKDENNHKTIQRFNLENILNYGKFERESDIRDLKKQDPTKYSNEWSIARGLDELYEQRQETRDERRRQLSFGQGGRKKNIRSSRKKRNSKKRAYKKRSSYKSKKM